MKKIINGKKYDTDTAKKVGDYEKDCHVANYDWYKEDLYLKRSGEFFLYGKGNSSSQYAVPSCGAYVGGENILPMTAEQARDWAEAHLDADDYEAVFGEVSEDDEGEKVAKTYSVLATTADRIERAARERGISQSAVVDELAASLTI